MCRGCIDYVYKLMQYFLTVVADVVLRTKYVLKSRLTYQSTRMLYNKINILIGVDMNCTVMIMRFCTILTSTS